MSHKEARAPHDTPPLRTRVLESITDVDAAAWDALAGPDAPPFSRHAWLSAMEESGSAVAETGWEPRHVTLWRGKALVAAAPAYKKFHSMGEYVYDFAWAHAAERAGIAYYPKLLVGAPLSPATSPRLMIAPGEDVPALRRALLDALDALAREEGCSGLHVLYPPDDELAFLEDAGLARRITLQFHWKNPGYASYDDYLARFDSKRRSQLKRERGAAATQGLTVRTVAGEDLDLKRHAKLAHDFYVATCEGKAWGQVQLTLDFFRRAFRALPDTVQLVLAERQGKPVAGAFNLATPERLYGRYWGAFEEHPFLHFHVCLYHSVDECIRAGRRVFEPGAGGEHKVSRGFEPTAVHSAHRLYHPELARAVNDFLRRERRALSGAVAEAEQLAGLKPWPLPGRPSGS